MNIEFQRAADRFIGVPICAVLSAVHRLFGRPQVLGQPRSILVILLSEMGSLVLAEAMFSRLRSRYPGARIHVLLFAKNREVLDLLGVVAPGDVLTLDDRSLSRFVADSVRALLRLRALKLDAVLDCELFSRISSIFSYLSGARVRAGFHPHTQEGLYRGSFINRPVMYNPYRHLSLQLLGLASALESATVPLNKDEPEFTPGDPPQLKFAAGEREAAVASLHGSFPALSAKRLVLVYPGGGDPANSRLANRVLRRVMQMPHRGRLRGRRGRIGGGPPGRKDASGTSAQKLLRRAAAQLRTIPSDLQFSQKFITANPWLAERLKRVEDRNDVVLPPRKTTPHAFSPNAWRIRQRALASRL